MTTKRNRLASIVKKMKVSGETTVFINAINLNELEIEALRKMIEEGVLKPNQKELDATVKKDYQQDFLTGKCIAPQMTYDIC